MGHRGPLRGALWAGPDLGPVLTGGDAFLREDPARLVMLEALESLWEAPHAAKPVGVGGGRGIDGLPRAGSGGTEGEALRDRRRSRRQRSGTGVTPWPGEPGRFAKRTCW